MEKRILRLVVTATLALALLLTVPAAAAPKRAGGPAGTAPAAPTVATPATDPARDAQPDRERVKEQVKEQVQDQAKDEEKDQEREQVKDQVRDQVKNETEDQAKDQVQDQAKDQVKDQEREQVKEQLRDQDRVQVETDTQVQQDSELETPTATTGTPAQVQQKTRAEHQVQHQIFINGQPLKDALPPVVKEGTTLVPLRALAARLKAQVAYDATTKAVTLVKGGVTINLNLSSGTVVLKDTLGQEKTIPLPVPPQVIQGSTFVPLRFIAETFAASVSYDPASGVITIQEPTAPTPVVPPAPASETPQP